MQTQIGLIMYTEIHIWICYYSVWNVIDWKSRKQRTVTKVSTYAEYVALSEAASEIKFLLELMKNFNVELIPVKIFEDNTGAINIANYGNFTNNSKHIEIHYHYVHESVREKEKDN